MPALLFWFIFAVNNTTMATKINKILQTLPKNSLLLSSWLSENGIDRKEQSSYVKSGWIERVSQGVYKIAGGNPTLYSALSSYNKQLSRRCHIGASTALDIRGFYHYASMGTPRAFLFTSRSERLPSWLQETQWDMTVRYFTTSVFGADGLGIEETMIDGVDVLISAPERAFMECLLLAPADYSFMDTFYTMEMLTTLRPKMVQALLEKCSSIKVKRMFLYMAEKAGHQWFKAVNTENVDLGSGNRSLAKNGTYISKYRIIIPKELANYE